MSAEDSKKNTKELWNSILASVQASSGKRALPEKTLLVLGLFNFL